MTKSYRPASSYISADPEKRQRQVHNLLQGRMRRARKAEAKAPEFKNPAYKTDIIKFAEEQFYIPETRKPIVKVARCDLKHSKGEDEIKFFDAFGPTVICTDQKMPPEIESRCLLFVMEKNISLLRDMPRGSSYKKGRKLTKLAL